VYLSTLKRSLNPKTSASFAVLCAALFSLLFDAQFAAALPYQMPIAFDGSAVLPFEGKFAEFCSIMSLPCRFSNEFAP
jgi:hypothetical protein